MAGFLAQGGAVDHWFDVLRSDIGAADTAVQEFLKDRFRLESERYVTQRILWVYISGVKKGEIQQFAGTNDANIARTIAYIENQVKLDRILIFNVLFALHSQAQAGDLSCATVLAGGGANFFDDVMNGGVVTATTNTINATLGGLGFPSLANTVVVLALLGAVAAVVYLKVKR